MCRAEPGLCRAVLRSDNRNWNTFCHSPPVQAPESHLQLVYQLLVEPAATESLCSLSPLACFGQSGAEPAHHPRCACTGQSWQSQLLHHTGRGQLQPLLPRLVVPSAWHACSTAGRPSTFNQLAHVLNHPQHLLAISPTSPSCQSGV